MLIRHYTAVVFLITLSFFTLMAGCKSKKEAARTTIPAHAASSVAPTPKLYPFLSNGKWGYLDLKGQSVISPRFEYVQSFSGPFARARENEKWGYIDTTGSFVIAPQFERARDFSEGLAGVRVDHHYGYVDRTGKMVIKPQFTKFAEKFSEGLAAVPDTNRQWGYIDQTGKWIIAPQYEHATGFSSGRAVVKKDGRFAIINREGEVVKGDFLYADRFSGGVSLVRTGTPADARYGFADTTGKVLFTVEAEEVHAMSDGMARMKRAGKWGFIDRTGHTVIEPLYDTAFDFKEGLAAVRQGKWGYVDKTGKMVVPPQYHIAEYFRNGIAWVSFEGGWGYINKEGELIWQTTGALARAGDDE